VVGAQYFTLPLSCAPLHASEVGLNWMQKKLTQ
jgi:hypothetical protein